MGICNPAIDLVETLDVIRAILLVLFNTYPSIPSRIIEYQCRNEFQFFAGKTGLRQ